MGKNTTLKTRKMVGMAIFTAIIVVLQLVGSSIKLFGTVSISLVMIPIVIGAAMYGPGAGAYFGGVFGVVVLIGTISGADAGAYILWSARPVITLILCLVKGILAGLAAGAVYRAVSKKNVYIGVILAAIISPIVNTGIFISAMFLFFYDTLLTWSGGASVVYYALIGMVGVNFLVEMLVNVVLSPVALRVIRAGKRS